MRKIASSSGRPTERSSCCCVPSPQSNSSRSPPRAQQQRGQPAARGRDRAGGAGEEEREVHGRVEASRARSARSATRAVLDASRSPSCAAGARRRSVGEPGLKIWKPSAPPRAAAGASGRRRRRRRPGSARACARAARPPGPASWTIAIRAPPASTTRAAGSSRAQRRRRRRCRARRAPAARAPRAREHLDPHEVAGVQDRVGGAQPLDAGGGERAAPARHVGVGDDREPHGHQPLSSDAPRRP